MLRGGGDCQAESRRVGGCAHTKRAHRGCTIGNAAWAGAAPLASRILADAGFDTGLVGKLHLAGVHARIEPSGDDGYTQGRKNSPRCLLSAAVSTTVWRYSPLGER
jgi:arylsulfatase A-like enzyme